jgi:hypothetical protein
MITINGYKFAEKESEIVDSLFKSGGTVSGRAKRYKRRIIFYAMQGKPFAFVNQENVTGNATTLENGKIWYGYGTPYFLKGVNNADSHAMTEALAIDRDIKGLIFK